MKDDKPESIKKLVAKLRKKHPDIRPNQEDDWDITWSDDGWDFLESGDYPNAEYMFEQLIVSKPDNFEGYEGLAMVRLAEENKEEAVTLINQAANLAEEWRRKNWIDQEVMDEIISEQNEIRRQQ